MTHYSRVASQHYLPLNVLHWRITLASTLLVSVALGMMFYEAVAAMVNVWSRSGTFAHGWLIAPISGYLLWQQRHALARLSPRPNPWGMALVVLLVPVGLMAQLVGFLALQQLVFVALLHTVVFTFMGWQLYRTMLFPLAYLFFAVPIGDFLILPLQDLTATATVELLRLTGIPVLLEGYYIRVPLNRYEEAVFHVAEACSGLRYLIASVALGMIYAYLSYRALWRRALFVVVAILFPIVANAIRAYGIVMLALWSDMQLAVGVDHLIYGWIFFGVVVAAMFALGTLWREPVEPLAPESSLAAVPPQRSPATHGLQLVALGGAILLITSVVPYQSWRAERLYLQPVTLAPLQAPVIAAAEGPLSVEVPWQADFKGANGLLEVAYRFEDQPPIFLYIARYGRQRQGQELINYANDLFNDEVWRLLQRRLRRVSGDTEALDLVESQLLRRDGVTLIVWHWYQMDQASASSPLVVKLVEAWDQLLSDDPRSAIIMVGTPVVSEVMDEARARLGAFITEAWPTLAGVTTPGVATSGVATSGVAAP